MKFTLAQYNIIRELIADEADAVGRDLANMEEKFKTNFPADKDRLDELNRILDKFNEVEL